MSAADPSDGPRFPRLLLFLGGPVAALVLIAVFAFLQFPFDRFADGLAAQAGAAMGAEVEIGRVEPAWGLRGPRLEAYDLTARWRDGREHLALRVSVRPAWSLAWLRGDPALGITADTDLGRANGTLRLGGHPGWSGTLREVALERLPLDGFQGTRLEGRADLEADFTLADGRPDGELRFTAREGSIASGGLPFALPYDTLEGDLRLGDGVWVEIREMRLEGPMLSAEISGQAGDAPAFDRAPLDVKLQIEVTDRNLLPTLRGTGLPLGPDGSAEIQVRGTPGRPVIR